MPDRADADRSHDTTPHAEGARLLDHPVPLWIYDRVSERMLAVNDAALAQYGYSRNEFLALKASDLRLDTEIPEHIELTTAASETTAWRHAGVCRHHTKDGRLVYADITSRALTFDAAPAVAISAYDVTNHSVTPRATDDTERELGVANDRLLESESRYRELVENLDDVVFSVDPRGIIQYISPAVAVFGYTPDDLQGKPFHAAVHPDDVAAIIANFVDTLAGAKTRGEYRMFDKAGQLRHVRTSSRAHLRDGRPVSVSGVLMDVTEHRRTQEQLKAAFKLEAIGRVATGIANDFNNVLVAITGFADLALSQVPAATPLHDDIAEIIKAGERAAALTARLLAIGSRQIIHTDSVSLNDVILSMEPMLRRLIGDSVELVVECDAHLPQVRIDAGHFEQAMMNLIVNARDAMPNGGRLRIATSRSDFPARDLPPGLSPGRTAVVVVSDTGVGMDEPTRSQVFEPFFTTKPLGQGTGLGLAMVYGFVKQSGGAIAVQSAPGQGTTFRIALPETAVDGCEHPEPAATQRPGAATILVTEDEATVRMLVRRVLERAGYRVLSAESADEALRICRGFDGRIDLLLTDVVMPQMSGTTLAQRTTVIRPGMRVLFMSSYSGRDRGVERSDAFLQKPFTAAALCEMVGAVLAGAVPGISPAQSSPRAAMVGHDGSRFL